jgi:hypothetical protein
LLEALADDRVALDHESRTSTIISNHLLDSGRPDGARGSWAATGTLGVDRLREEV